MRGARVLLRSFLTPRWFGKRRTLSKSASITAVQSPGQNRRATNPGVKNRKIRSKALKHQGSKGENAISAWTNKKSIFFDMKRCTYVMPLQKWRRLGDFQKARNTNIFYSWTGDKVTTGEKKCQKMSLLMHSKKDLRFFFFALSATFWQVELLMPISIKCDEDVSLQKRVSSFTARAKKKKKKKEMSDPSSKRNWVEPLKNPKALHFVPIDWCRSQFLSPFLGRDRKELHQEIPSCYRSLSQYCSSKSFFKLSYGRLV